MIEHPVSTLSELIRLRAADSPEEVLFIVEKRSYTCSWLWETSRRFALSLLKNQAGKGERILVLVPNGATFFIAFYGCMLSGAIAVPVFPNAGIERCSQLMQLCGGRKIILPEDCDEDRKGIFRNWAEENNYLIYWVSESPCYELNADLPSISESDIAFIQYTSGSTDFPKGVPLSHYHLISNIRQMAEAVNVTPDDIFVSWLPVYHDMGLILMTMVPLYIGARLVLLNEGLHSIPAWLKTIQEYKGTFIAAPDTAYRLCVNGIRDPGQYDLSSLRVALNASEPIHLDTYKLFEEAFNLENVMTSGYGLAEATVAVTMHPASIAPRVDKNQYVSSGLPVPFVDIRIEHEHDGPVENQVGEILVKSPAQMLGYFNKSAGQNPFDKNGYLKTGDIGYLDGDGYLFVLARKKNIIKHAGHTIYPDDVEQVVKANASLRNAAAIGIVNSKRIGESLFVFVELRKFKAPSNDQCHELVTDIVQSIYNHFGIRPGRVFLVNPKTLPRTPNGKLQHAGLKKRYLDNNQDLFNSIIYPRF